MSNNNKQVLSVSEPSICIPRVFENIEKKVIWGVFTNLFGSEAIDRIDIVYKDDSRGEKFKRVFVHFKAWPNTYESQLVRRKLVEGKEVKIVYDEPWYWKCTASRIEKPATRERMLPRHPLRLMKRMFRNACETLVLNLVLNLVNGFLRAVPNLSRARF